MIAVTFRPIEAWPEKFTEVRRRSPFSSPWSSTLQVLDRELRALEADRLIVQLALDESQIRLDGWPRSGASPEHPGVIVAFESTYGPLKYATDVFTRYEDNLRAIGLGLEALRRVDRYGVTKRGQQYTGWRALGSGEETLTERGRKLIADAGSTNEALKRHHPDKGGDPDDFHAVRAAMKAPI